MSDTLAEHPFDVWLREETERIERGPIHMRAVRANTHMIDWGRKEQILLQWAKDQRGTQPFKGEINAFHCARAINHFAALKQKWSA